jgi:hypothetical protein
MEKNVKLTAIVAGVVILLAVGVMLMLKQGSGPSASAVVEPPAAVSSDAAPTQAVPGLPGSGQADTGLQPADPALRSGK